MSLKDLHHFVTGPDRGAEAQRSQQSGEEEILQSGQAGEEEESDWETTGGTGGRRSCVGSAGGLQ